MFTKTLNNFYKIMELIKTYLMALVFHERLGDLYRAGRDGLDCQETHASRVCQVVH